MKNFLPLLYILFLGCNSSPKETSQPYHPKFPDRWAEVANTIQVTWHQSRVDSTTWQMQGSLELPKPYMSIKPGRNVLFGWDPYFTNIGLLQVDSLAIYAQNATENQMAEIGQIGYIPNASEPWALNRSQPPFLAMMTRQVYEQLAPGEEWLNNAYEHILKEHEFWMDSSANTIEDNTTSIPGLQRYYHHATDAELIEFYSQLAPRFGFSDTISNEEKVAIGEAWMAEAETGMDFTPRFENRCPEFVAIDLNSNLYMYEQTLAWIVKELDLKDQPNWEGMARQRKDLIRKYCWSEERGFFLDYDFVNQRHSSVASAAGFYPLWAGIATPEQAKRMYENLDLIEYEFGPTVCEKKSQDQHYQWDYPAGWPPMYYVVAKGLDAYGYDADAKRIATKYLDIVTKNFIDPQPSTYKQTSRDGVTSTVTREPGFVYEKYNAVEGTINDSEYPGREFQGWSYGVFMWAYDFVNKE